MTHGSCFAAKAAFAASGVARLLQGLAFGCQAWPLEIGKALCRPQSCPSTDYSAARSPYLINFQSMHK